MKDSFNPYRKELSGQRESGSISEKAGFHSDARHRPGIPGTPGNPDIPETKVFYTLKLKAVRTP